MAKASRPPLGALAALALALYAFILCAGPALLHDFACSGHGAPHCLLCGSVGSVASAPERSTVLQRDRSDAGLLPAFAELRKGVSLTATVGDRAPPA